MKVHVVSETSFSTKGNGVHTAFIDLIELLNEEKDIEVIVNGEGTGDIFHCHTYGPYYFWKGRHYKGRRILTVHVIPDSIKGSLPFYIQLMPFVKWYFKKVYHYADVCIALSPMVEKVIRNLDSSVRIVKIYNPIHINRWKRTQQLRLQGRSFLGFPESCPVVLGVGQLEGRKGVEDFIDIAEAIPEANFVWVGGRPFGQLTEGIRRINKRTSSAPNNIYFTGMLDLEKMPSMYAAADVFLFTSYQENCPLAPLEAAASGMPVVFRDIEEYALLYENPYYKCKTTMEFITITKKFLHDQEFYAEGLKNSNQLLKQFDKTTIRNKLLELYQNVSLTKT